MHRSEEFFFAWEGATASAGPWAHLAVLEAVGTEAMNRPYEYTIDLARVSGTPDVALEDLLGARATLKIRTRIDPPVRLIHGVISEVEELADVHGDGRFRVRLTPPFTMARMLRRCAVHVDKRLVDIFDETLTRAGRGMGLERSTGENGERASDHPDYRTVRATYVWRVRDTSRLYDEKARPYCVQYEESDVAFVERLLEEEGIGYHFEHTDTECRLVLSDVDSSRLDLSGDLTLAQDGLNREVRDLRLGGRMRPMAYGLVDYDWRKPDLFLAAVGGDTSESAQGTLEQPGRFEFTKDLGQRLADVRFGRLETERRYGSFASGCRALGAGVVVSIEHTRHQFSGKYLVASLHVRMRQPGHFADSAEAEPTYEVKVEAVASRAPDQAALADSGFRPERRTPRPRISGSQTAVVTSETDVEQEINVGGDADVGSVRLRFHWDLARTPKDKSPTSCWVRVSQMFAGGKGHGAIFNPRVGDEVVVEFLEGDPDRPLVTGRVYNGRNLPPENITNRPTYSCIKSMTSPYNGNFNLLSFEDQQDEELIMIHAARDFEVKVERNTNVYIGDFSLIHVHGRQHTIVDGFQKTELKDSQFVQVTGSQEVVVTGYQSTRIGADQDYAVVADQRVTISGVQSTTAGVAQKTDAPTISETGNVNLTDANVIVEQASTVLTDATAITHTAAVILIDGGIVTVSGGTVIVDGGTVNVSGGSINLNC